MRSSLKTAMTTTLSGQQRTSRWEGMGELEVVGVPFLGRSWTRTATAQLQPWSALSFQRNRLSCTSVGRMKPSYMQFLAFLCQCWNLRPGYHACEANTVPPTASSKFIKSLKRSLNHFGFKKNKSIKGTKNSFSVKKILLVRH